MLRLTSATARVWGRLKIGRPVPAYTLKHRLGVSPHFAKLPQIVVSAFCVLRNSDRAKASEGVGQ